jgi:hypothetical protein
VFEGGTASPESCLFRRRSTAQHGTAHYHYYTLMRKGAERKGPFSSFPRVQLHVTRRLAFPVFFSFVSLVYFCSFFSPPAAVNVQGYIAECLCLLHAEPRGVGGGGRGVVPPPQEPKILCGLHRCTATSPNYLTYLTPPSSCSRRSITAAWSCVLRLASGFCRYAHHS